MLPVAVSDESIGRNLARFRGQMSQKELADAMRLLGWRWNQGTVSSIESGERPLRLAEAEDLARVFHLAGGSTLARGEWEGAFADAWAAMAEAARVLEVAVDQYLDAQIALALAGDDPRVTNEHQQDVRSELARTPEQIVNERRRTSDPVHEAEAMATDDDIGPLMRELFDRWRDLRDEHPSSS